jgi:regulatory protein
MEIITVEKALIKAYKYCAYQERCQQEVREKLYSMKLATDEVENIIVKLIEENFLNEERFAIAYASGKFRIKKWGKVKIKHALKQHQISDYCIKKALKLIDLDEYISVIEELVSKKYESFKGNTKVLRIKKTQSYLFSRGFETEYVSEAIRKLLEN